jgi:chemotaxis signal transduction protein
MDLLLAPSDLREVVASSPVAPLPGRPRGIQGVVIYQGEFLPVLAWEDLPECPAPPGRPVALAVLRPRLGLPIEQVVGMVDLPTEAWQKQEQGNRPAHWLGGVCRMGDRVLFVVDPDRLVGLLHGLREDR